ncbi:hypothetical protein EU523_01085 [Candidatus Heimdallarchaeota archaeon]|nr:MAG: hypothetical protein EU523_01085 [Candidatus Heimdallarchaeota archaeon]
MFILQEQQANLSTPYQTDDIDLDEITLVKVWWTIFKISSWKYLAHHPICSRYRNHTFKIGSLYFCVGCTSMYIGIVTMLILFFTIPMVFQEMIWVITTIPFCGFSIAILHFIIQPENKWLKAFLRLNAGIGIGAFVGLIFLVPNWWVRLALFVLLLTGYFMYGQMRGKLSNYEKCLDCPLHYANPPCRPKLNTEIKIMKLHQLLKQDLNRRKGQEHQTKTTSDS